MNRLLSRPITVAALLTAVLVITGCQMIAGLFGADTDSEPDPSPSPGGTTVFSPSSVEVSVDSLEDLFPTVAAEQGWNKSHLSDGVILAESTNRGWSSATSEMPQMITLTFDEPVTINTVVLYPRNDGDMAGTNFPSKYKIEVSSDGQSYTTVSSYGYDDGSRTSGAAGSGRTARSVVDTENGVHHDFDSTEAQNVRVTVEETDGDRTQLSEMEVGEDPNPNPGDVEGQEPDPNPPAPVTVDPIDYVLNTDGQVYEDPRPGKGDIQGVVHHPHPWLDDTGVIYYIKHPNEGWRFERFRYNSQRIYLERDTTWPAEDNGGFQAYDALQSEYNPAGGWVPYDAFVLAETFGMQVGSYIDFQAYIAGFKMADPDGGNFDWTELRDPIYWPGRRTLVYRDPALDTTAYFSSDSDLGIIDVIVLEIAVQPDVASRPTKTERHWYAKGIGWVRWQVWNDPASDPNFAGVLHAMPDNEVIFYRRREGMPELEAFSSSHHTDYQALPWLRS